ncbi:MAG: hypothetical protein PHS73_00880 [Candidatus Peribacteraceae bacterium]|nr:hypothetical protein [Candidatus Peribacteraceae bacterium]
MNHPVDLEVELKTESSKATIAGKTAVPFRTFVGLVLQRKVLQLFKQWGEEPIILSSELLTGLASAPQDSQENRTHLIIVTLGVGTLFGIFALAVGQAILSIAHIDLGLREFLLIAGSLAGIAMLVMILARIQRVNRAQKVADTMEKVAQFLSRK